MDREFESCETGCVQDASSKGRPQLFDTPEKKKKTIKKLKNSSMREMSGNTGHCRKSLRTNLRKSKKNPSVAFPYLPQKAPQIDKRMKKQSLDYVHHGIVTQIIQSGK